MPFKFMQLIALYHLYGILYKLKLSELLCFSLLLDLHLHLAGVHLLSQCAGLVCVVALLCCPETYAVHLLLGLF